MTPWKQGDIVARYSELPARTKKKDPVYGGKCMPCFFKIESISNRNSVVIVPLYPESAPIVLENPVHPSLLVKLFSKEDWERLMSDKRYELNIDMEIDQEGVPASSTTTADGEKSLLMVHKLLDQ